MKILFITLSEPAAPFFGGNIRSKALLEALMEKHEVTLMTFYRTDEQKKELQEKFGSALLFKHNKTNLFRRYVKALRSLFSKYPWLVSYYYSQETIHKINSTLNKVDFVLFDSCFHPIDEFRLHVPFAVSNHNVESRVFEEMTKSSKLRIVNVEEFLNRAAFYSFPLIDSLKTERLEKRINSRAKISLCVSELDQAYFKRMNPNTYVIENGTRVRENVQFKTDRRIMFLGTFFYKPNRDAFTYFVQEIYPSVSDIPFEVVGAGLKSINHPNIHMHGYVVDLNQIYDKCGVFIVPLLSGGGTRLKILEALANKIPIVTTSKGAEGLALEHRRHVLIADTPKDFAASIRVIFTDPVLAERLVEDGYEFVKKYSWEIIGQKFLQIISKFELSL
jgi:glycosyltransferase involved in cell wall biosynthesis